MSLFNSHLGAQTVHNILQERPRLWFIGIGGIHMAALALYLHTRGFEIAGSDAVAGAQVERLRRAGVPVFIGQDAARVARYDAVVYTLAIGERDPEYLAAKRLGLPLISRAELLGALSLPFPVRIGVSGSHGKSTTTAMLSAIFAEDGRDPTVFCGAPLSRETGSLRDGQGADCILEACEYRDSFLCFAPTVALVLNIEMDHADYFPDPEALCRSFAAFAALPGQAGMLLYNAEDAYCRAVAGEARTPCRSFGLHRGDCHAENLQYMQGRGEFSLVFEGKGIGKVQLAVAGEHNIKNALAAALCALTCGIPGEAVLQGLARFRGAARRLEYKGLLRGARVFDDYAHHPSEIRAALATVKEITPQTGRVFAIFQPHTYTRTKALFPAFCEAFALADRVIVADIYAAREQDTLGMSAALLANGIGAKARYVGGLTQIAHTLEEELDAGDTLVVMGAGDIDRIFYKFWPKGFTLS